MTFRRRMALFVTAAVTIVAVAVVSSVYFVIRAQLRSDAEQELRSLAQVVRQASSRDRLPTPRGPRAPVPPNIPRIIDADGSVIDAREPGFALPVTPEAQSVAAGELESSMQVVDFGSERYAVVTLALDDGRAVQIARSYEPIDEVLDRLLSTSFVAGGGVVLLAPVIGYAVAGGALVPVRRLRRTAERVARDSDLARRAEVRGDDDLAALATSFNAMLDRLEAMVESLERAQSAQRSLVADASHELRTPLAALRANVELLALGSDILAAERATLASDTLAQIDDLTVLIEQLIDLEREDEREAADSPVALGEVVQEALDRMARHHPSVTFTADLDSTVVSGSREAVSRAIANLLDNAGKWSPDGGSVEVTLHRGVLEVRDHGPGIEEAELPHVFQRFYRGARARGRPGSGLGLAIVAQVAASHGGKVRAERPSAGTGTVVRLELPPTDP